VSADNSLSDEIIAVSQDYLGPASERFINRQASTHLNKKLEDLTRADLVKLVDWIRLSFALLTNDSRLVDEYASRLLRISKGKASSGYGR
jgi:hypothetical protein